MNDIFAAAPTQSVTLQHENVPPPNSILQADLHDPNILGQKRVASRAYLREMKSRKALRQEVVTTADEESGESYVIAAEVAALAPALAVQMPQMNVNPLILQIQQLSQQLAQFENHMKGEMLFVKRLAIQSRNASATKPNHPVYPPPSLVDNAPNIPPPQCPRYYKDLFSMNSNNRLVPVETYYGLGHEGTIDERRQRLFVEYGFRE